MVLKSMLLTRCLPAFSLAFALSACGGPPKEATAPSAGEESTEASSSETSGSESGSEEEASTASSGPMSIPTECHNGDSPCTPSPKWVKKLCEDVYPGVALYLFQQQSPFTHAYLSRKTRAVNASGGATSGDEWLRFDEEVVLLYYRKADTGGIQVSGAGGGYDAMRLDGSCVTLGSDEVRMQKPPTPKYSKVPWRYIGDDMQDALRKVPDVRAAYIARRKECRGAFSGTVSKKCLTRDEELNTSILKALQSGDAALPEPELRP